MLSASAQSIDIYSVTKKLDINKMLCMVTQNIRQWLFKQRSQTYTHGSIQQRKEKARKQK